MKICPECNLGILYDTGTGWGCPSCSYVIKDTKCRKCGKREATENWVGEGGTMGFVHGMYSRWCKICCLEAKLEYAKEITERIPKLEKELEELKEKE